MVTTVLDRLSVEQKKELAKGVIEVEGKTMNATALGVVDALIRLYPYVTFAELKQMLPDEINPGFDKFGNPNENGKKYDSLFKPTGERLYGVIQPGSIREESEKRNLILSKSHFVGEGQTFKTADGVEVLVSYKWESKDAITGECDIDKLIKQVEKFGVRVVSYESAKPFKRGEYALNIINPSLMTVLQKPPRKKGGLWIILALILALLAGLFFFMSSSNNKEPEKTPPPQEPVLSEVVDTTETEFEEIKSQIEAGVNTEGQSVSFHEILFEKGSDEILPESGTYLNEVFQVMTDIPALKMRIVGHTSSEGDDNYNLKLSSKRAIAVSNFLQSKGIDSLRLSTEGKGSLQPMSTNDNEDSRKLNRRIEFVITEDGIKNE